MKSSELFLRLKKDLEKYRSKVSHNKESDNEKNNSINEIMSRYNLENFNEIINSSFKLSDEEIDEEKLKDFILTHFYCTEIDSNQKKYKINIKYIDKILNNNGIKNKAYQFLEEDSKKNIAETLVIN